MTGRLIGVGVGPGDPELMTVKAIRLIQKAPILAYPIDAHGNSYAKKTAMPYIRAGQMELPLLFSMSRRRQERLAARREAAGKVLEALGRGQDVIYITEGDPLLYSTFQHLLSEMPPEVIVEVCPGISAMASASADACFPLAIEGQRLMVSPAKGATGCIQEWLAQGSSVVLFKVAPWIDVIAQEIKASRIRCDAILVERSSMEGKIVVRCVEDWMGRKPPYFSIILIRPTGLAELADE